MKQLFLCQSTLENRSGLPVSSPALWFSAGLLAVQGSTKTQIPDYKMLLRRPTGTCNFKAPGQLNLAPTNFPLHGLYWGNTQTAGAGSTEGWRTHRDVFNLLFFHYLRDPHTGTSWRIFRRRPDATYRIPLFLWFPGYLPTIHSPIHTSTNISHHLWRGLHKAPGFINSNICDAVINCWRLSQHSDTRFREEVTLSKVRAPHEILHSKQRTTLFIFGSHHRL